MSGHMKLKMVMLGVILLSALIISSLFLVYPPYPRLASFPSWNNAVSCTALLITIEGIIGDQTNSNGGATYAGGFQPGIPDKRSTSPPCAVNGNATFVEIHKVKMAPFVIEDCIQNQNATFCDSTANILDPNCTNSDTYLCRIHVEIDRAWNATGIAPQTPPSTTQLVDVQGFVYWDSEHVNDTWHSYSGWEIHPLTAWRISSG